MYARRATYSKARLPAALFERDFSLATLGADATFARSSTGYVKDYQGVLYEVPINTPRFEGARWTGSEWSALTPEGSPITGIQYLNEPGSTNICGKVTSDPASAIGNGATFAAYTSGLGVPTGKLIASTGTEYHYVALGTIAPTAGASYCVSAYVKKLGYPIIRLRMADSSTDKVVLFNLDTLEVVVGSSGDGLSDYGIEPAGDGFYRIWLAGLQSVASNRGCQIYMQCSGTYNYPDSTPGDGVNGLIFGGWQVEQLPYPTSFIATTSTSPVSRAADGLSYSGVPADNETRIVVDGANSDTDDWDGVVDEWGRISRIQVYAPGGRP